jgi:hemolysin III
VRGVFHELALYSTIPLGIALGPTATGRHAQGAAAVFAGAVVAMFAASALYHRFTWSPGARLWLRRLDHAAIFGLIAGTYTPFGLLVLHGARQTAVLAVGYHEIFHALVVAAVALQYGAVGLVVD